MRTLTVTILLLGITGAASAQGRPAKGDTLRFLNTSKTTGEVESPAGPQQMNIDMRMQIAMTVLGGDSAVVWLDSVSASGPVPGLNEAMAQMLGRRMTMRFRADGTIEMDDIAKALGTPAGTQFTGSQWPFILPRPGALRPGATWSDTARMQMDTLGASIKNSTITRFQVMGDSVYEGIPVTVIGSSTEVITSGTSGGGAMAMSGKGTGSGRLYYASTLGLVVKQTSSSQIESNIQVADMSMTSRNKVENSMLLLRRK